MFRFEAKTIQVQVGHKVGPIFYFLTTIQLGDIWAGCLSGCRGSG